MPVLTQRPPTMRPLWTSVALLLASLLHVEGDVWFSSPFDDVMPIVGILQIIFLNFPEKISELWEPEIPRLVFNFFATLLFLK